MIHTNSIKSYKSELPHLHGRRYQVFCAVYELGRCTDRQIKERLGFSDMNNVRPSVTKLITANVLNEAGTVRCAQTGKTVRLVEVAQTFPTSLKPTCQDVNKDQGENTNGR